MEQGFRITGVDDPDEACVTAIGFGIRSHNEQHAGKNDYRSLGRFLPAPDGSVVGGLIGATYRDRLYSDLFWVREQDRRQGHGQVLLMAARARQRGSAQCVSGHIQLSGPGRLPAAWVSGLRPTP